MKRRISEIPPVRYGDTVNGIKVDSEPSAQDIQLAIDDNQLETRGYQSDLEALKSEWLEKAKTSEELGRIIKSFHARRIAYFVVHGWCDPIVLSAEGNMTEGTHRLKAAIHKGMEEVEIIIPQ